MPTSRSSKANLRRSRIAVMRGMLAAVSAMVLTGCYTVKDTTAAIPTDYRQRHPIVVKETDHTVEVFVGASRGGLNAYQRADVLAFAQTWRREATGGIIIDQPVGTPNEVAAEEAVREARSIFAGAGIPLYAVAVRPYRPQNRGAVATVKLNYPRMSAEAGPCGLWPADLGPTYEPEHYQNKPYWNLGCATQRNLAAMAANPSDLVQPRGETPPIGGRRSVVLEKYRKGEATGTAFPTTNTGAISDIGR